MNEVSDAASVVEAAAGHRRVMYVNYKRQK